LSEQKNKNCFVLDTFSVLTYLKEEAGWEKVRDLLNEADKKRATLYLNYVNLGELYYITYREYGAVSADKTLGMIKLWPLNFVEVKEDIAIVAGRIKAENKLSYADAYVVATALTKRGVIVTGDQEFKSLEEFVDIQWLLKNR
jgi:predicted nucleic acid-binding protein